MSGKNFCWTDGVRISITTALLSILLACTGNPARQSLPPPLAARHIDVASLPRLGDKEANIAIIEVTDYQCPFCRAHHQEVLPLIRQEFIDTGVISYFVQSYPLPGSDFSGQAAIAASCAHEQGYFWRVHDRLFQYPFLSGQQDLHSLAVSLGLDEDDYLGCIESWRSGDFVARSRSRAVGLGVRGTPTFLVGRLRENQVVTDVSLLAGRHAIDAFREILADYQESGR